MNEKRHRKPREELIRAIFSELEKGGTSIPKTPNEIGVALGTTSSVIKGYLDIIEFIQSKPKVLIQTGKKFTLVRLQYEELNRKGDTTHNAI